MAARAYSGGILEIFKSNRTKRPKKEARQSAKTSAAIKMPMRTRLSLGRYFSRNSYIRSSSDSLFSWAGARGLSLRN